MAITCARCYDHKRDPVLQHEFFCVGLVDLPWRQGEFVQAFRGGHTMDCPVAIHDLHATILLPDLDHKGRTDRDQDREFCLAVVNVHVLRQRL